MDSTSPPAARTRRSRWSDRRLLAGVVLMLASVAGGGAVVGAADRSTEVWALRRTLPAGAVLRADDLLARRVRLYGGDARRYLDARAAPPAGAVLRREVGAGELLPVAAVAPPGERPARRVMSIPVPRARALGGDVERGMKVDVLATYAEPGGGSTTVAVLRAAMVVDLVRPPGGFAAGRAELGILVEVPPERALALASALETAAIDVLRVVPGRDGDGDVGAEPYAGPRARR